MRTGVQERAATWLPAPVALLLISPFCLAAVSETDAGWHLALGRLIASGTFPRTNALSWTVPGHGFYPTSWLFDWLCYLSVRTAGVLGLQVLVLVLMGVVVSFMAAAGRAAGGSAWWTVPLALMLTDRVVPRPHLASWAILAATVFVCVGPGARRWQWRAALVPFIALASNFHAGAVFASCTLGVFCLEAAVRERRWIREALVAGAGLLALTANPGGPYNVYYAVRHLSMYQTLQLTEFAAPSLESGGAWFVMAPLALGLAWISWPRAPAVSASSLVFAAAGLFAVRLAFNFLIVLMPLLAGSWPRVRTALGGRPTSLLAALVAAVAMAVNVGPLLRLRVAPDWDDRQLPVRAVRFIHQAGLDGKLWNGFTDGGFLEWALPQVPAYQDARVLAYDPEFFHAQQRAERSAEDFKAFLRQQGVEWVLTTNVPGDLTGNGLVGTGPDFALVYWDDLNEIYVRRDVPRLAPIVTRYEYRRFVPSISPAGVVDAARTWPRADVQGLDLELDRFLSSTPDSVFAWIGLCGTQTRLGGPRRQQSCAQAAQLAPTQSLRALAESAAVAVER